MEVHKAIETRRAYRSLAPMEIDDALVAELARAAGLAASCFNKQPWRYVFVYGDEALSRFQQALATGNAWARNASMLIAVISEKNLDCVVKGRQYFLFDTGMATANLILRATELGLVAHPMAGFDEAQAKELLAVPAEMTVITIIAVGRKREDIDPELSAQQAAGEKTRPERLPLSAFAFRDRYGGSISSG